MTDWAITFIETVGYPGIVVLMILEIPIPIIQSEIVMTFSGFTAANGDLNLFAAIAAGVTGSQFGSVVLYWLCTHFEEERVNDFLERWGGWLGFDGDDLERGQEYFRRHDRWAVLIGRLVPGLRGFIAVPAGIQGMSFPRFFTFNLLGTAFWVSVLAWLGSVLGENYGAVDEYSSYVTYALLGGVAAWIVYRVGVVTKQRLASN